MTLRDSATPKHMQACTAVLAQKENRVHNEEMTHGGNAALFCVLSEGRKGNVLKTKMLK